MVAASKANRWLRTQFCSKLLSNFRHYSNRLDFRSPQSWSCTEKYKTKTVITQKQYKIAKACNYKIYRSKSCDPFKILIKSVAQTIFDQSLLKQVWV